MQPQVHNLNSQRELEKQHTCLAWELVTRHLP